MSTCIGRFAVRLHFFNDVDAKSDAPVNIIPGVPTKSDHADLVASASNNQTQVEPYLKDRWKGLFYSQGGVKKAKLVDRSLEWIKEDSNREREMEKMEDCDESITKAAYLVMQAEDQAGSSKLFSTNKPFEELL